MDNFCTIYSHELCFDDIVSVVKDTFPKAAISTSGNGENKNLEVTISAGLLKAKKKFQILYRERAVPSYNITKIDSDLTKNLSGMIGFVESLSFKTPQLKDLLIQKIHTLNSESPILSNGDLDNELRDLAQKLAQKVDGIIFSPPNTLRKSNTQLFLNKDLQIIVDLEGNSEVSELAVKINSKYYDGDQSSVTESQKQRKSKNEAFLRSKNVKINEHLPCIESDESTTIRTTKEIAERVTLLATTNMVAFNNITGQEAIDYLTKYNLLNKATPKELDFLKDPTDDKKMYETWKCEGIWVLMWALKIVDEIAFPNELVDLNKIPFEKYPIGADKDPNEFINSINQSRSKQEIMDANDLYYRMDWACVDARIKGEEIKEIHPGIVYERHYALNWLINYMNEEWDDITCDT